MTSKPTLAAIKAAHTKFKKAWAKFQKFGEVKTMGGRNAYEDMASARDDFATVENMEALLAVADAAMAVRNYQDSIGDHVIPNNREVEHLMGLHEKYLEALKALD